MGKACGHIKFHTDEIEEVHIFLCMILTMHVQSFFFIIPIILTSITVASSKYFQMLDLVSYTNVE